MGAYWLCPIRIAWVARLINRGEEEYSGKPCARLSAPYCCANADITANMY